MTENTPTPITCAGLAFFKDDEPPTARTADGAVVVTTPPGLIVSRIHDTDAPPTNSLAWHRLRRQREQAQREMPRPRQSSRRHVVRRRYVRRACTCDGDDEGSDDDDCAAQVTFSTRYARVSSPSSSPRADVTDAPPFATSTGLFENFETCTVGLGSRGEDH